MATSKVGIMTPPPRPQVLLECWGGDEGQLDAQGRPLKPPALALSADRQRQLRTFALVVNELLRHLWACVPANTEAKQAKLERVVVGGQRVPLAGARFGVVHCCAPGVRGGLGQGGGRRQVGRGAAARDCPSPQPPHLPSPDTPPLPLRWCPWRPSPQEALHSQDNELQQVMNSSVYPERSHVVQVGGRPVQRAAHVDLA